MQELVVESLVVSLAMVVFYVLVDETTQMPLAERDHACETLLFDRPDEPLGIGVVKSRQLQWWPEPCNEARPSGADSWQSVSSKFCRICKKKYGASGEAGADLSRTEGILAALAAIIGLWNLRAS